MKLFQRHHLPQTVLGLVALTLAMPLGIASYGSSVALAATTCAAVASPTTDISVNSVPKPFDTDADIEANFEYARTHDGENCSASLVLPAGYDKMTSRMQMFTLFNLERGERTYKGTRLPSLHLDNTLMSQIDLNHDREMRGYHYFAHPSPINHPSGNVNTVFDRLTINPALKLTEYYWGEIIAYGYPTAAEAVFGYMYDDAPSSWGHRQNILGYYTTDESFGHYDWVGVGVVRGPVNSYINYYASDFLQDTAAARYSPPTQTDTKAPTVSGLTYAAGVAKVAATDTPPYPSKQAGVTGVVFYVGSIISNQGGPPFNTVNAHRTAAGSTTWTAKISVPAGKVLHAVAVDGSGNYKDCTAKTCP